MTLKFKNRIALFNVMAVALTTAMVFLAIYLVVYNTAYSHLDEDIEIESEEVISNLDWRHDSIIINRMPEWDEAEHKQIEVNPTFLQITNLQGAIIFRSTNLIENQFLNVAHKPDETFYNGVIGNKRIRLGEFPIINESGKTIGRLTIAVSQQESFNILNNLIWVLVISFPLVGVVQFFASSVAASKAIKPVHQLIRTASGISDSNINNRLVLPRHKDELYELTLTINELLNRIEKSIHMQKQFTSDASHEIRTPLSAIRGMLEVLIRRQREPRVYEQKIEEVISQVDRLDGLLEQLLQLARIDSDNMVANYKSLNLSHLISNRQNKWSLEAAEKKILLHVNIPDQVMVLGDPLYLELILDNLLNNAIKYGIENGNIFLDWNQKLRILSVHDDGIGISAEQLPNVFNRFYRSDESRSSQVRGNGLGLSIVKKLADLQHITLTATSQIDKGSTFTIEFQG